MKDVKFSSPKSINSISITSLIINTEVSRTVNVKM